MELLGLGILLVVALGAIILGTRGVFARDLTQALKRVNQQEQELQEKADILEQRLNQLERDYQAKLKRAEAEAERILQDAKTQAQNIRTLAVDESKHRARQVLLEAEQAKGQLKAELSRELDGKSLQHAGEVLRALLPQPELQSLHQALVAELLDALTRVDTRPLQGTLGRVDVTVALPLLPADAERLTKWVTTALGSQVKVQMQMDPGLVAGGVIRLGPTVVDNSLKTRLSHERRVG